MNFNSPRLFDLLPMVLEVVLHLLPFIDSCLFDACNTFTSLALKRKELEAPLNHRSLLYEILKLLEVAIGLVTLPNFLDHSGCQMLTSWSFKLLVWHLNDIKDLSLVGHAM